MSRLKLMRRGKRLGAAPPEPGTGLAPSPQWDGTAGSGFGGAFPEMPTDPERTTAKPTLRPLFTNWMVVTRNQKIGFVADCPGGLQGGITVWLEGNSVNVPEKTFAVWTDLQGVERNDLAYWVQLDHTSWVAMNSGGVARMVVEATPNDPTMQKRVLGMGVQGSATVMHDPQLLFFAKDQEFDYVRTLGAGGDFTTVAQAKTFCEGILATEPNASINIHVIQSGDWSFNTTSGTSLNVAGPSVVFTCADGVTAYPGDGTNAYTQTRWSGIEFRGAGWIWDTVKLGYELRAGWRVPASADWWGARLTLNGVEVTMGTPNPALGGSGSGWSSLWWGRYPDQFWFYANGTPAGAWNLSYTECDLHDMVAYGYRNAILLRHSVAARVSGSNIEGLKGAMYGGSAEDISGYLAGLSDHTPAFTLTGDGTVQIEFPGGNGASGNFNLYVDGASTPTHQLAINNSFTSSNTTMAQVVSWINGLSLGSKLTATLADPGTNKSAAYMSMVGEIPGGSPRIAKRTISGTATITGFIDVHADTTVWSGADFENVWWGYHTTDGIVATASLSFNNNLTMRDVWITAGTFIDRSAASGKSAQPGYVSCAWSNVTLSCITMVDTGQFFGTGSSYDAYSSVRQYVSSRLTWTGIAPDPDLTISSIAVQTFGLPSGADANSKDLAGAATSTLFTDVSTGDVRPLSPLLLNDGTYAGRYDSAGNEQAHAA